MPAVEVSVSLYGKTFSVAKFENYCNSLSWTFNEYLVLSFLGGLYNFRNFDYIFYNVSHDDM